MVNQPPAGNVATTAPAIAPASLSSSRPSATPALPSQRVGRQEPPPTGSSRHPGEQGHQGVLPAARPQAFDEEQ